MNDVGRLISLVEQYAYCFPFRGIEESLVIDFEESLGGILSVLLRTVYKQIGRGGYFMTIPFFFFDGNQQMTTDLKLRLNSGVEGYVRTGRELVVGAAIDEHLPSEPMVFFASDFSEVDPTIHCLHCNDNKIMEAKSLSEVVKGLRGFPDCTNVPQGLFDYYWYLRAFNVPIAHSPTEISIKIMEWKASGRQGMEERFKGHSPYTIDMQSQVDSVFRPYFYL
jgi:hypothetical protein